MLALEAMKMETVLGAHRDGKIKHVHVTVGTTVSGKDLLVVMEPV